MARLSYSESCQVLQQLGYLDEGPIPPLPARRPLPHDDEPLGVSFFRTAVADGDLQNLTLPRTFFGRSKVGPISFRNTDLSESTLCWNDFSGVDFTAADLSGSDLRSSIYRNVCFRRANLRGADLRRSSFAGCDFTDADMARAKLTHDQARQLGIVSRIFRWCCGRNTTGGLTLSEKQCQEIDWHDSDGEAPPGG